MKAVRSEPFPHEAARDLLGVMRALYVAMRGARAGERPLAELTRLATQVKRALEQAERAPTGSLGHAAAWERLEAVSVALPRLIDCATPLEPTLRAALARLNSRSCSGANSDRGKRSTWDRPFK